MHDINLNNRLFVSFAAFVSRQMFSAGRMFSWLALATGTASLTVPTQATAAPVVDQSQPLFTNALSWPGDLPNGQSFTAGLSGTLTEIALFSTGVQQGGSATLNLYSGDGLGGPSLGSVGHAFGPTGDQDPISFDISSLAIHTTVGSQYTFAVTQFTGSERILFSVSNPYSGGRAYTGLGDFTEWDLMFTTSVDVPEPSSAILLATGLVVLAMKRKRVKCFISHGK